MADGPQRPSDAEKSLGEIVGEVSEKASLLVREEIELAKAEVTTKVKKLGTGAALIGAAAFLGLFVAIFFFQALAWGLVEWFDFKIWAGFGIVALFLLVVSMLLLLLARRAFKKGSPPVPEMAIDEAKKTRAALEEARS
jgi:hypothetical protein